MRTRTGSSKFQCPNLLLAQICENTNWVEQIPMSEFVNAVTEIVYGVDNILASEGWSSRRQEKTA